MNFKARKRISGENREHSPSRIVIIGVATLLIMATTFSAVIAYDNWLQTSKDASSSGYSPGISMYPINEYPRPASGVPPSYAYISGLDDPYRGGNIGSHIAAWYEGSQVESNLRVAFTTTNRDNVGAIYCVDSDGDNIDDYPIFFEDGSWESEGDAESSIAVYYDGDDQEHDTLLVAALNNMDDGIGNNPNQVRTYDLDGDLEWWYNTVDWLSRHCSPVIWIDPEWGDSDDVGDNDDDFVYVFEYDSETFPGMTRVVSLDLTIDESGDELEEPSYVSPWFEGLTPTYCTPVICEVPSESYEETETYMFFLLDQWTYSENVEIWLKTGTRAICIDIDPNNNVNSKYDIIFNIQLPIYWTEEIPDPMNPEEFEEIDHRYTVNMDPAAVHMIEDYGGETNDWYGFVFGTEMGSYGFGKDIFFVENDGTISAMHDLSYPATKYGSVGQTQTNPIVIGSPAVRNAGSPYYEEIYVLYKDRETGCIGTAYFRDVTVIDDNQVHLAPIAFPNDYYQPVSPVITDEFLYVGCSHVTRNLPYGFAGGMTYINLDTIRSNKTMGFFHTLPWSLDAVELQNHWNATPAIIQTSSSNQYLYMGTSDLNLYGGMLWRLST